MKKMVITLWRMLKHSGASILVKYLDPTYRHIFKRGDSSLNSIQREASVITIKRKRFKGTRGLWEFLNRKNVNTDVITTKD